MNIQEALERLLLRQNLARDEMKAVMEQIMTGGATPSQIGGFLVALRMKGETVDEVTAAAEVMRSLADGVSVEQAGVVDIVGTGGDTTSTFNVSTASALVAAASGVRIAKHGNRSVSSKSGAADLLETAGVNIDLSPSEVAACVDKVGVGFMFAPRHHNAMKHAIGPRREMGVRTIFNLLGPLTNPASAPNQVLGVFDPQWVRPLAEVLGQLGSHHVMVVHGENGMDEISCSGKTFVAELHEGQVREYSLEPAEFGLGSSPLAEIVVDGPEQSLAMVRGVLANEAGAARDIVQLNAGAAIYVGGLVTTLAEGVALADKTLASGAAAQTFEQLISFSNQFSESGNS